MPPKTKSGGKSKQIQAAKSASKKGQKKKKWSKTKVRDTKATVGVLFDSATYTKLMKQISTSRIITPFTVADRLNVNLSLARRAISELLEKGVIRTVVSHHAQKIYTRVTPTSEE
eukprot:gnl/Trimastix_PCT/9.p2 GENE.gnl/Trimastix_PCT/9~~gnl/Trimastix_PCT/9.p2  ORF type:complete len:115 (+),score=34.99 gnl/Trimastix_PCT/9:74-418(+)